MFFKLNKFAHNHYLSTRKNKQRMKNLNLMILLNSIEKDNRGNKSAHKTTENFKHLHSPKHIKQHVH